MAHKLLMVENDTAPQIDFTVKNGSARKDLTDCQVDFFIKNLTGTGLTNTGHTECTITDAENGLCRYDFQANDIPAAGTYHCDVQVTNGDNTIQTEYNMTDLIVRAENG